MAARIGGSSLHCPGYSNHEFQSSRGREKSFPVKVVEGKATALKRSRTRNAHCPSSISISTTDADYSWCIPASI